MLKQRRWFWVALIVLITGWISFWLYRASADFPPSLRLPDEGSIGEMGPIILEFPGSVERSKVEAAWYLEPRLRDVLSGMDGSYGFGHRPDCNLIRFIPWDCVWVGR